MINTSDNTKNELLGLRSTWKPMLLAALVLLLIYLLVVSVEPGWVTYILSMPALIVVAATALIRANDIPTEFDGRMWHVRRFGLILVGLGSCWLLAMPLGDHTDFPTWKEVLLRWGFALTWLTTPNMPPWWYYVTGQYKEIDPTTGRRRPWWYLPGCPISEELKKRVEEGEGRDQ